MIKKLHNFWTLTYDMCPEFSIITTEQDLVAISVRLRSEKIVVV